MRDLTGFRKGIVRIRVQGEQTERFLNLCKARKIKFQVWIEPGNKAWREILEYRIFCGFHRFAEKQV